MFHRSLKEQWEEYRDRELKRAAPILEMLGFALDENQPHTSGERYLMSGRKLVLLGSRASDDRRVVIKVSSDKDGRAEMEHEQRCRGTLHRLSFAGETLLSPPELLCTKRNGVLIIVTEYVRQNRPFLSRPTGEQFDLALKAFRMQESVHAATYAHARIIRRVFGMWNADDYMGSLLAFQEKTEVDAAKNRDLLKTVASSTAHLSKHKTDIERYTDFLTHEDFALHNLRIADDKIYLIDHASLRFGNKHEGWARFMNFMLLYNRPLEEALGIYMKRNRSPEENLSLHLMRIYKIIQLLTYHARASAHSAGNMKDLSEARVGFWTEVLKALLAGKEISNNVIENYKKKRDSLRSEEETQRQKELQQLV